MDDIRATLQSIERKIDQLLRPYRNRGFNNVPRRKEVQDIVNAIPTTPTDVQQFMTQMSITSLGVLKLYARYFDKGSFHVRKHDGVVCIWRDEQK